MATTNVTASDDEKRQTVTSEQKESGAATLEKFTQNQPRPQHLKLSSAYCGCVETNAIPDS
jgi:hypothetical protein